MRPVDIQQIGDESAIKWESGAEIFIRLETMRRSCPCAGCKGEADIMGQVYKSPDKPFTPQATKLLRIVNIGGYAIQPVWADGHATGIYTFDYLQRLGEG